MISTQVLLQWCDTKNILYILEVTSTECVFFTCKNWSSIKSFQIKISRSSLLHIVVWSLRFCYISLFWMWGTWASCTILSNKNAQIEKVTNITSEKHTLLDLFAAMGFDDRTFFSWWNRRTYLLHLVSDLIFNIPTIYTQVTHCLKAVKITKNSVTFDPFNKVLTPSILIKIIHVLFKCVPWFSSIKVMYYIKVCVDYEQFHSCFF